jgi:hypothetical protein
VDSSTALRHAIMSVSVPGAPPRQNTVGAAIGLSFLDSALRLNHIRRLSETLTVTDHRVARRTTEIDISLAMLDEGQRRATMQSRDLRNGSRREDRDSGDRVWVPVARIARRSTVPVVIWDPTGARLPRLTQSECGRLLASGLFRLLHGILDSLPGTTTDSELHLLLHRVPEAEWLVQHAIDVLVTERRRPPSESPRPRAEGVVAGQGARYRPSHWRCWTSTSMCSPSSSSCWTSIPAYHLVVDAEPGVDIARMYLSTDTDARTAAALRADLLVLAQRLDGERRAPTGRAALKILELQMQTTLRSLADLVRRRRWEAAQGGIAVPPGRMVVSSELGHVAVSGEGTAGPDGAVGSSVLRHPALQPEQLAAAADELFAEELYSSVALENDPSPSRAHASWHGCSTPTATAGAPVEIRAGMLLRDTTAAGPRRCASTRCSSRSSGSCSRRSSPATPGRSMPPAASAWARSATPMRSSASCSWCPASCTPASAWPTRGRSPGACARSRGRWRTCASP